MSITTIHGLGIAPDDEEPTECVHRIRSLIANALETSDEMPGVISLVLSKYRGRNLVMKLYLLEDDDVAGVIGGSREGLS